MTPKESTAWRPTLPGWSEDILPFYAQLAPALPRGAQVVEVGVAWGRSLLFLAEQLVTLGRDRGVALWAVDSWDPSWTYPPEATPAAAWTFPPPSMLRTLLEHATPAELAMVRLVRAPSRQAARLFLGPSLDVVFLDGDHSVAGIVDDLTSWAPLVKSGGLLAGHDYDPANFPDVVATVEQFAGIECDRYEPLAIDGTVWSLRKR